MPGTSLTCFTARDIFGVSVDRLCFGRPVTHRRGGKGLRTSILYGFSPGQLFGVVWHRWRSDGCQHRAAAIVEAVADPVEGIRLPGISKGVLIHGMIDQPGPAGMGGAVDRLLVLIQTHQKAGIDPAGLSGSFWRDACRRIMLQQRPPLLLHKRRRA
jgi:hypothetical protein